MADDVVAILDAAGCEKCHFVGHALGGLIGLGLALRHPGRLASLVPVNAWARLDPHTARCFAVRTEILHASGVEAYLRAQPLFLHPAVWLSRHAERLAQEEARAVAHFQGAETLLRRIGAIRGFDIVGRLAAIATPTLAMFETGRHASNVTDPEPFNAALLHHLEATAT